MSRRGRKPRDASGAAGTATVAIERIGGAGDGVATLPDGTPLFVPFTLPGETVTAGVLGKRGEGRLGAIYAIDTPSPERVAPPCPHFGPCGGCALQHWADAPYAAWKRARLSEALARAGFADAEIGALQRTPPQARRRADLALRRAPGGGVTLGFFERGSGVLADLRTCLVLHPRLVALFAPLRTVLAPLQGLRRDGSAVLNLLDTGPDLLLRTDAPLSAADRAALAAFGQTEGLPRIAWALGEGTPEPAAQLGPVAFRFGEAMVAPPPGAFLQASPQGEAAIVAAVLAGLPERLPARATIADLYAGLGTLSFPLAGRARVAAFEGDVATAGALDAAARQSGGRVIATRRDLARQPLLPAELAGFAAVVLDPPYAGAAEQIAQLARSTVARIVYVSCNPVALARDAGVLRQAGWSVLAATPVDQFLWSPHLEAVLVFAR